MAEQMTAAAYREITASLGLATHPRAASALGVSLRTAKSYASGEFQVPSPTAKLLRLWLVISRTRSPLRRFLPVEMTEQG